MVNSNSMANVNCIGLDFKYMHILYCIYVLTYTFVYIRIYYVYILCVYNTYICPHTFINAYACTYVTN